MTWQDVKTAIEARGIKDNTPVTWAELEFSVSDVVKDLLHVEGEFEEKENWGGEITGLDIWREV